MSAKVTAILVAAVFLSGVIVGWVLARRDAPAGQMLPQIKYIEKLVPVERIVQKVVSVPEVRFVTREVEKLRVDTVFVPVEMRDYVLAGRQPLSVSPSRVDFTYFDPGSRVFVTDRYSVPSPRIRYSVTAGIGGDWIDTRTLPNLPTATLTGSVGMGRISAFTTLSKPMDGREEPLRVRVGLRYKILGN